MRCSKCGTDNAAGSRFCNRCAAPLGKPCPKCAHENTSEAKFCAQCAAPLDVTEPIHVDAGPRDTGLTGERRHLTVLFCDLVGSTALSAQLDPEEWRQTVAGYHRTAAAAITRFGGRVAKYLGDGVMAFFGWPEAHADAAVAKVALLLGPSHLIAARRMLNDRIDLNGNGLLLGDLERLWEKLSE